MEDIPSEILQCIVDLCDNESKVALIQSAKWLCPFITSILIDEPRVRLIKNKMIDPVELIYTGKSNVSLSYMSRLKKLTAHHGIDQSGIIGLNLTELCARDNSNIRDVSWMTNLQVLHANENCGIDQSGIAGLNLTKLHAWNNNKIKDVSWMTNLQVLDAGGKCKIDQAGIAGLNLTKLNVAYNDNITDVSWMKKLRILYISSASEINTAVDVGLTLAEFNIKIAIKDIKWFAPNYYVISD